MSPCLIEPCAGPPLDAWPLWDAQISKPKLSSDIGVECSDSPRNVVSAESVIRADAGPAPRISLICRKAPAIDADPRRMRAVRFIGMIFRKGASIFCASRSDTLRLIGDAHESHNIRVNCCRAGRVWYASISRQ